MTLKKNLGTLLPDIHRIFEGPHEVSEENLDLLAENVKETIRRAVQEAGVPRDSTLRMSVLGTPNRKLWYSMKYPKEAEESLAAQQHINFCYGHIIEEFLLFLVREAGHEVANEQKEVEVNGVVGHIDCEIDGVPVDVKSASEWGFKKFKDGNLLRGDDPYGYVHQISGYTNALGKNEGAFVVMNKNRGELCVLEVPSFFIEDTPKRIDEIRDVLDKEEVPPRCYDDQPFGKAGNRELVMSCVFCPFKFKCWPETRVFRYSDKDRFLTTVVSKPKVDEVTQGYKDELT